MIFKNKRIRKKILRASAVLLSLTLAGAPLCAAAKVEDDAIYTEDGLEDYEAELTRNKAQAVQTNLDAEWPHGPAIGAAGAVIMDADSGAVLYGKNMNKHLFPASITKLMTALLAYENLDPDDTVTFSENAVFGIERGSSNIGMDVGESITVAEALYGLMVASANEVSIALGERVSGTESNFVALMNERAAELGCKNTHFVTTNGLHDSDHYTCAYDMALIAREIYRHPDLVNYMSQMNYHFEASSNQPDDFWILNTNDFLTGEIPCEDVIGGKTGYTDQARETLVSFAERDGKRLICVILREEPPFQYYDTIDLLNYAFDNFKQISVSEKEDRFTQKSADFLSSGTDIFGNSTPSFYISEKDSLMVPNTVSFSDLTAQIIPATNETKTQEEGNTETEEASEESKKEAEKEGEKESGKEAEKEDEKEAVKDSGNASTAAAQSAAEEAAGNGQSASASSTSKETAQASEAQSPAGEFLPASSSQNSEDQVIGVIQYKFHDYNLGTANVMFRNQSSLSADTGSEESGTAATTAAADLSSTGDETAPDSVHGIRSLVFGLVHTGAHGSIYLNILFLIPLVLALTFLLCILIFVYDHFAQRSSRRRKQLRRAQRAHRQNASRSANYESYDYEQTPRLSGEENTVRRRSSRSDSSRSGAALSGNTVRRSRSNTDRRNGSYRRLNADRRDKYDRRPDSDNRNNISKRNNFDKRDDFDTGSGYERSPYSRRSSDRNFSDRRSSGRRSSNPED